MTRNREDITTKLARLEARPSTLDAERAFIREQIAAARRQLAAVEAVTISVPKLHPSPTPTPTTHPAKVALFASLFRGREDVYPRFWTNERKGTKGWAPFCSNEWKRPDAVTAGVTSRVTVEGTGNEKPPTTLELSGVELEREKGFEPSTLALARRCSTTELFPQEAREGGGL